MPELLGVLTILAATAAIVKVYLDRKARTALPYPPGPKPYPIIGNILDIPKGYQWSTYTEWGKQYGDIMHLKIFGEHLIIINSEEIANDLFEKRSRKYSDRPNIPVMQMNGWQVNMGVKHYNNDWRRDRRILHQKFRQQAAPSLHPLELAKSRVLLHDLLRAPKDFELHFQLYPASIIMYLLYGHQVDSHKDPLVEITFETIWLFSGSVFPGTAIINIFPALAHLPGWFPGMEDFHRRCVRCKYLLRKLQDIPFDSVKRQMAAGTAAPCYVSELLEKNEKAGGDVIPENIIKALGASTFAAAMETTLAFMKTFFLAMVLFPEVQERAQAEIDAVVGNTRLPTHDDRPSLPYIDALYREVLRWHGPAPLAVPHAALEDDVYNGYFIPKGATILTNQWAMWRDERVYPNADEFRPERFLTADGTLTNQFPPTFGFGRRACVGKSMADSSIWIAIASVLSVFRLARAKDEHGNEIPVSETNFSDGIVSLPLDFDCSITPRSEAHKTLILENPPIKLDSNPMIYD